MPRRADASCGNHFANGRWKNRDLAETPAHSPDLASSDIPTGAINAKSSPLSRHRPHGRSGICRPRPIGRSAQGGGSQHRARARRFRRPDELAARCRYPHEEGLHRHARRKSAHVARRRRRCHQTGAGEAGRQDRSRRPLLGRRGHHAKPATIPRSRRWSTSPPSRPTSDESLASLAKAGPATEGASAIHPDDKGNLYHRSQGVSVGGRGRPSAEDRRIPGELSASVEPHGVRGARRYGGLARQADVLCDQHQGQGDRTRGPEDVRGQDARRRRRKSPAAMPRSSSMRRKSPR